MALEVTLVRDSLKDDGSLRPRVVQSDRVTMDELLDYMATDTALEATDMRAGLSRLSEALLFYLGRGERVNTPIGSFGVSARGTYVDGETPRVETRNIGINFRPDPALLASLREHTRIVMRDNPGPLRPVIQSVMNADDSSQGAKAKPGHIMMLRGTRLGFDETDDSQGVFFVAEDGSATRASVYSRTGSTHIDCKLPELPAASYTVEVRARSGGGDTLTGTASDPLPVKP